ncbi:MAG TPA: hypothetical protein VJ991_00805 [Balneolales bacterium]|nr:hypothetical protein [Balneolales bacterium]
MNGISRLILKSGLTVFVFIIIIAAGCSSNNNITNTNPVPDTYYGHHIQVIFNQTCGSGSGNCHINGSAYGVNLSSYNNVMNSFSSEYGKKVIIPGNATGSPLYDKIGPNPRHGYRMPWGRSPLSAAQIDTIRVWINNGATDK